MPDQLEGRARDILTDGKNYAIVAIPRADGTVQSVITWVHTDDEGNITLNSAEGRVWPRNLRRAKTATVTAMADSNPYEYVAVTARLIGETHDGADADADRLAKKYLGVDTYPFRQEGEVRVVFTLAPERVTYLNPG